MKRHLKIAVVAILLLAAVAAIKCTKAVMPRGCPGQIVRTQGLPGPAPWEPALNGPVKEVQTIGECMSQVDRYDQNGNLMQSELRSPRAHFSTTTYSYNSKGELVAAIFDGPFAASCEYSYFPKKRELVSRAYAVTETESSASSSTVLGQIKSLFSRGKRPRLQWTTIDTFDASGKHIKNRFMRPNEPEMWSTFHYDSKGRLVAITDYDQGWANPRSHARRRLFRPDSNGNAIDKKVYNAGKLAENCKTSYIYDHRGNWVEKHMTFRHVASGKPLSTNVCYRKISYYDGSGK